MKFRIHFFIIALLCLMLTACQSNRNNLNPDGSQAPQAHIEIKGSDTMVNLALAWTEAFRIEHPDISISITGGGSGTGIAALLNNTVDIANASRHIKEEEISTANSVGIEPFELIVARDAVAVIVNHSNPIDQLTMQQISDIYAGKYNNWQDLGGDDRPIVRTSRETNSGTHVFFLEEVLRLGDPNNKTLFDPYTLLLPSSEGIIAEVRDNPNAIGYDGLGYVTPEVKVIGIAPDEQSPFIWPSMETVSEGTYPIARDLYAYTNGSPQGVIKVYLDWIQSDSGQKIVSELGFIITAP